MSFMGGIYAGTVQFNLYAIIRSFQRLYDGNVIETSST